MMICFYHSVGLSELYKYYFRSIKLNIHLKKKMVLVHVVINKSDYRNWGKEDGLACAA